MNTVSGLIAIATPIVWLGIWRYVADTLSVSDSYNKVIEWFTDRVDMTTRLGNKFIKWLSCPFCQSFWWTTLSLLALALAVGNPGLWVGLIVSAAVNFEQTYIITHEDR